MSNPFRIKNNNMEVFIRAFWQRVSWEMIKDHELLSHACASANSRTQCRRTLHQHHTANIWISPFLFPQFYIYCSCLSWLKNFHFFFNIIYGKWVFSSDLPFSILSHLMFTVVNCNPIQGAADNQRCRDMDHRARSRLSGQDFAIVALTDFYKPSSTEQHRTHF